MSLHLSPDARVCFLTGAGVSVASGLPTYRGPGGLWNTTDLDALVTAEAMANDPAACWRAHRELALNSVRCRPNAAHHAIAQFASRQRGTVTVLTQNIDGLHTLAGSTLVVELHGSLRRVRCTASACAHRKEAMADPPELVPTCPLCSAPLRYDIVLFGEYLDVSDQWAAKRALRACDVFIAAGTSGLVQPASGFAREADYAGARTVLVNLDAPDPPQRYFADVYLGRAELLLPELLAPDEEAR